MAEPHVRVPVNSKRKRGRPRHRYDNQLSQTEFRAVEFYMQGCGKTESMLKAGYSKNYSEKRQTHFFNRDDISREVEKRRFAMKTRNNKIVDRIQDELAKIAFFNIGEVIEVTEEGDIIFNYDEATMEEFAAIGEITVETYVEGRGEDAQTVKRVKVKPYDKKAALDSLARIHGMFNDKLLVGDEGSLEQRLQAGRQRARQINAPDVVEGDYEVVGENE